MPPVFTRSPTHTGTKKSHDITIHEKKLVSRVVDILGIVNYSKENSFDVARNDPITLIY